MSEKTKQASFEFLVDAYKDSNNQFIVMVEEIMKQRKMNNAIVFGVENAIADLMKPNSDGTIALDELKRALANMKSVDENPGFNIHKKEYFAEKKRIELDVHGHF